MNEQYENSAAAAYWGDAGLESVSCCAACGGGSLRSLYAGLEDLLGQVPGVWGFKECKDCAALNLDPRPAPGVIGKAYPSHYVTHTDGHRAVAEDNGRGLVWAICNRYLNDVFDARRRPEAAGLGWCVRLMPPVRLQLDYFYRHLPRKVGRVLDVGCGNGAFLQRASAAGWDVKGIEPDAAAVEAAIGGIDIVHSTIEEFSAESDFDYITLSHVFEHLHEPQAALDRMIRWLRPGGCIWMSMPNPSGIGRKIYGPDWFHLDPPRHLCLATPSRVKRMLEQAGFVDVAFLRRGRGSKTSVFPSEAYAARRRGASSRGARLVAFAIDMLASLHPRFSEETVVRARRP